MLIASAHEALALYQERINAHDFDLLVPLIAEDAVFWFNDGSHIGIEAARAAFEKTWSQFRDESYWLEDLQWLAVSDSLAACRYRFCWHATFDGVLVMGHGRGTSVLSRSAEGWKIIHEHLSADPKLIDKVCPVVMRGNGNDREILVFRHPLAGVQLVKGTLEDGEAITDGALRELAEESGIVSARAMAQIGSSDAIAPGQRWYFVQVEAHGLAEEWAFDTLDDGGHRFEFFWWPLQKAPGDDWHEIFPRALDYIRENAD